jgi:hypothetical protein
LPQEEKRKINPIGMFLRMLRKHELKQVIIMTKSGKPKTINDIEYPKEPDR